jgi:hypothetical protein
VPLQKQPIDINFIKGLDLKSDPFQVDASNFLSLNNSVFTTSGRLTKRNGFKNITSLPNDQQSTITTLNDNLIATGSSLYAYSEDTNQWLDQGIVQPVQLDTLPLVRVSTSQTSPDTAVASNGLTCLAYIDSSLAYYQISDSATGQQIVKRTALPSTAVCPRVFILGVYFIVMFIDTVSAASHLQYIAIPIANPTNPMPVADSATNVSSLTAGWDGYVVNNTLYVAYESASGVTINFMNTALSTGTGTTISGATADLMTVSANSNAVFIGYWNGTSIYSAAFNYALVQIMSTTTVVASINISEITSVVPNVNFLTNPTQTLFFEVINDYGYDSTIRTDYISGITVTNSGGTGVVSSLTYPTAATPTVVAGTTPTVIVRSVGLASKSFIANNDTVYMLGEYGDTKQTSSSDDSNQPTYFLIDETGAIYMRLAYSNGGGYAQNQVLSSVTIIGDSYYVAYLNNDFLAVVNKGTNLPTGTPVNAIYTQTGVNLATFELNTTQQYSVEIAGTLNLTGGMLWEYDGVRPVENNFQVWPENVEVTTATTGGSITAGTYYYVFTYEWTNNQGNLERSAPSIPVSITTTGSTSTNTINVPTDRLTYKVTPNPIRIVGYRWSVAQQVYYQFTSLTSPTLNNPSIDYVTFTDTFSDAEILGNVILYTTGGVVEDIAAPPSIAAALFDNRVWLIDAEDQNLLWFSKQVIEDVPVEMSDLLTFYVAPTTSAQGSTGTLTSIYPMDDKLILFKKDAIYYINGTGPDNTGSNSQYSQPIFVTSAVGCANQHSIVLTPQGLMFQSDKGIWILGRDLSTNYIGAPVESYNTNTVKSATAVPATTQVRFILDNSTTLMYDYFFQQWGTHSNVEAISATLYQSEHTYLNSVGNVFQELPGTYLDGSTPVLMSLTTAWIHLAGLQGFERFYQGYLLGTYYTPFTLNCTLSYDYNPSSTQAITVLPQDYVADWGGEANWGSGGPWGGPGNVFRARLFPEKQKCESFQLSIQEVYDPSYGQAAGQGLTLSGLSLILGVKRGWRTQNAAKSFG